MARRRLAAAAALGLALALLLAWLHARLPQGAGRLAEAAFSRSPGGAATPVALPHRWREACPDCRAAWYRFDLPAGPPPAAAQAVYLPAAGDDVAVYFNGHLLGGGRFAAPLARHAQRPQLFAVPAAGWQAPGNRLIVGVAAEPSRAGFLAPPYLGDEQALLDAARARSLLCVTLPQAAALAAGLLGLLLALLAALRRREPAYGWLAAAALAWAAAEGQRLLAQPWWPAPAWDALGAALRLAAGALLWVAARRVTWVAASRAERVAVALALLAALAVGVSAHGLAIAQAAAPLLAVATAAVLLHAAWRGRSGAGLALAAVPLALLGLHDAVAAAGPLAPPQDQPQLPLAMAFALALAGGMLLSRFVDTVNAVELLNVDLEALVADKTAQLQDQFERVRRLEREQAVLSERERLMRDMHDGVGGSLVSLLAMIESGRSPPAELGAAVRGALDDLRLMIDSLEPVDGDLQAVLATFVDRLGPRLRAAGVAFEAEVGELPPLAQLTPSRVLDVLRLLQEAVANALKHGGARRVTLSAQAEAAGALRIEVADDGRGFDPAAAVPGRGLRNMARRAAAAGGRFDLRSAPGAGTRVRLYLQR